MPDRSPEPGSTNTDPALRQPIADPERLRQRAVFLRELAEARALVARATPMRTRTARLRARMRQRPFRA